jgi:peptidoglycan lytic transglycosylase A
MRAPARRLLISLTALLPLVAPVIDGGAAARPRHGAGSSTDRAIGRSNHQPAAIHAIRGASDGALRYAGRRGRVGWSRMSRLPKPADRPQVAPAPGHGLGTESGTGIRQHPIIIPPSPPLPASAALPGGHPSSPASAPLKIGGAALEPARWEDLDGWTDDDHVSALSTFRASCRPILRSGIAHDSRPVRAGLQAVCARAVAAGALDEAAARAFFEANFRPVRIRKLGDVAAGFLTGYYEPIVDGSRFPTREFTVPVYRRPPDLIAAGASRPGGPFPNTGRAYRLTASGERVPYYDRGEIEDGALDGRHLEICWLRSATEALFIGIEGSARIRLEDGTMLRINYDAHNGYPYVPVGRVLIERKLISREEMSMQRIREWMHDHPDEAEEVRRQNRSMVFFRIVGLNDEDEALGAQGIPLSAGRSIAVDKALHVFGTPFFIEADLPPASGPDLARFRRTMIAQDTGSAIVGPARADLYFGAGEKAGEIAGRIRQAGRFAMLLPRELDPVAAGAGMPLPRERPPLPLTRLASLERPEHRSALRLRAARFEFHRLPQSRFEFHRLPHRFRR